MFRTPMIWMIVVVLSTLLFVACGSEDGPAEEPAAASEPEPTNTSVSESETEAQSEAAPALGGLRTFTVVPEESSASYIVEEEFFAGALSKLGINAGLQTITGSTTEIEGELQINLDEDAPLSAANFTVNLPSLTTDQDRRDKWIRENGPSLNSFPIAEFVANEAVGAPSNYTDGAEVSFQLLGDLTIRDVTRPTTFDIVATLTGDTIMGSAISEELLLTDFDIEPPNFANTLSVANEFHVEVSLTARE
ncbi:YceI family protein [Chloroflexi bacterium TSY]|nr:YceI family protein [Chloroflexi bacterium TSY]